MLPLEMVFNFPLASNFNAILPRKLNFSISLIPPFSLSGYSLNRAAVVFNSLCVIFTLVVLSSWFVSWVWTPNLLSGVTSDLWKANRRYVLKQPPFMFVCMVVSCLHRRAVRSMATCAGSSSTSQEFVPMSVLPSRSSTLWHRLFKVRSIKCH